jgi:predicted nucleic acid-binding protein
MISGMAMWWATPVECYGALARAKRAGRIAATNFLRADRTLRSLFAHALEIEPWEEVRELAVQLATKHPLRAADALQLAAALAWCSGDTRGESFVCLDDRLRGAAALEGFRVLPYSEEVNEARVEYMAL